MEDLDFSNPAPVETAVAESVQPTVQSSLYNPALALEFFRSAGTVEQRAKHQPFFTENEKPDGLFSKGAKMYLLLDGEVGLMLNNKFFGIVKPGEIFGELAVIAGLPRTASAMAMTECHVMSLDKKQFQAALQKTPGFALMLMSIMVQRLRKSIATLAAKGHSVSGASTDKGSALDKKMLSKLTDEMKGQLPTEFDAGKVIVSAGAAAALMYIVLTGTVAILIGDQVVEELGPGGIFGEMALLDNAPRTATVTAVTDCTLLSIGRNGFLELVKAKPDFSAALLNSIAIRMQHVAMLVSAS